MYVYIQSEISGKDYCVVDLWTVGHYDPNTNEFIPESDHNDREEAAKRVHYLNGGK